MRWGDTQQWGQYLGTLGIPGLFVVALLDSAAVPIPGGAEALAMVLAWRTPAHLPWIVLAAALGSTIGALVFYRIGLAGGDVVLSRLAPARQAWVRRQVARHGFWALFVSVLLPPPFPAKPMLLAAGLLRTRMTVFLTAVFSGRVLRYTALGYVGFRFGDQAARVVATYFPQLLMALAGLAFLLLASHWIWRSHSSR